MNSEPNQTRRRRHKRKERSAMTKCSRPRTLFQLMANTLGRELLASEKVKLGKDRGLTPEEAKGVKHQRMARASSDRRPRVDHSNMTVAFYRRAVARFERWARSAEKRGLDKARPPRHIAEMAIAVTQMAQAHAS